MALAVILQRDLTAYFKNEAVKAGEGFDQVQAQIEDEIAAKLREFLQLAG